MNIPQIRKLHFKNYLYLDSISILNSDLLLTLILNFNLFNIFFFKGFHLGFHSRNKLATTYKHIV